MITRINIQKGVIVNREDIPDNWIIDIKLNRIWIISLSNAKPEPVERIFFLSVKDGSLFLHNSTHDWYYYFRDKDVQDVLDEWDITRMITSDSIVATVVLNKQTMRPLSTVYIDEEGLLTDVVIKPQLVNEDTIVNSITGKFIGDVCVIRDGTTSTAYVKPKVNIINCNFKKLKRKELGENGDVK